MKTISKIQKEILGGKKKTIMEIKGGSNGLICRLDKAKKRTN